MAKSMMPLKRKRKLDDIDDEKQELPKKRERQSREMKNQERAQKTKCFQKTGEKNSKTTKSVSAVQVDNKKQENSIRPQTKILVRKYTLVDMFATTFGVRAS